MTTKQISRLVVMAAVVISGIVLIFKLITGAVSLAGNIFSTILGLAVIIAMIVIVVWMFSYAKKSRKK